MPQPLIPHCSGDSSGAKQRSLNVPFTTSWVPLSRRVKQIFRPKGLNSTGTVVFLYATAIFPCGEFQGCLQRSRRPLLPAQDSGGEGVVPGAVGISLKAGLSYGFPLKNTQTSTSENQESAACDMLTGIESQNRNSG
jgi:hypothetical protein